VRKLYPTQPGDEYVGYKTTKRRRLDREHFEDAKVMALSAANANDYYCEEAEETDGSE
jgi:hypothetical protein